ncbi:MAG: TOBE domain-containing protein [Sulfurovum sp.]
MNNLIAKVSQIDSCDNLHIVNFICHNQTLSMMSLELESSIEINTKVKLIAKPTHIALAKGVLGDLSYSNQLPCTIESIDNGKLLSSIKLQFFDTSLESIITLSSSKRMQLEKGDKVVALIKASDLFISKICD